MRRKTLTVTRLEQATIDNRGNIVVGNPTTFEINASVQPADKVQMEATPKLRDFRQVYILFSNSELLTADAVDKTEADRISIYGKDFEVITCEVWQNKLRSHYKIMVAR